MAESTFLGLQPYTESDAYRFKGRTHDVAGYHLIQWPVEKQFLEQNVILGHKRTVDATVQDDSLPSNWGQVTLDTIYR